MAKVVREPLLTAYRLLDKHKFLMIGVAGGIFLLLAFQIPLKAIIFIPALFAIAVFSTFYKRIVRVPPAFELISLATVAVGFTYGGMAGAVFGAATALTAEILNSGIDAFIIGYVIGRAIMGALAGFAATAFPDIGIVALGLLLVIIFNIIAQSLYLLQGDPEAKMKTAVYVFLNVLSNWAIFAFMGRLLIAMMA